MAKRNTKNPNGSHSVYKTKDGRWVAQIVIGKSENGKLKYKRFTSDKQYVVIEKMREFEQGFTQIKNANKSYLSDFLTGYIFNVKKNVLKPSSFDREVRTGNLINKYIGNYTFEQLSTPFIQTELINKLKDDNYSYSTIHKAYVLLNECLQYAVDTDKLEKNPCRLVKQPPKKMFEKKEIRWLSEDEIKLFKEQAVCKYKTGNDRYIYGLPISLIIYTGLRCGELAALKPCDIKGRGLNIRRTEITFKDENEKQVHEVKDFPKSDAGFRTIIMSKEALNTIENIFMIRDVNDEYLFSKRGKRILSKNYGWHLRGVCKELGIPFRSMHKIRKTYGTTLIDNDVDDSTVVEQMGHSDIKCTKQYYYFSNKSTAKKIEQIDKAISW